MDVIISVLTVPFHLPGGRSRSATILQIKTAIREVAAKGIKEVILTGVNTGDFGRGGDEKFLDLIKELDQTDEIKRYRISSVEPNLLTDEIIEFVARSRHFMPHFHIPLQSGSNEVLKLMHRRYSRELFAEKIKRIKSLLPDAFIGVDIIVGMRGETETFFQDSRDFIAALPISRLHVFPYSERQGTKALDIPFVVSQEDKHQRVSEMLQISEQKLTQFYHQFASQTRPVLFEDNKIGKYICGFTDNYIKVQYPYDSQLANQIIPVTLDSQTICMDE